MWPSNEIITKMNKLNAIMEAFESVVVVVPVLVTGIIVDDGEHVFEQVLSAIQSTHPALPEVNLNPYLHLVQLIPSAVKHLSPPAATHDLPASK